MENSFAVLFSKEINSYDFGEGHPFHKRQGEGFLNYFREKTKVNFPVLKAEKATDEDLLLICEKEYLEFTKNYFEKAKRGEFFDENFFRYHSADNFPRKNCQNVEEAARFIVGQAKLAADLVWQGKFKKVISIGGGLHHAKKNFGEGFCIYNDVAFCAKYLVKNYGLKRILILDTDAHCGNGTMEYFYEDNRVLFVDLHQDPKTLYPGTGFLEQIGKGKGEGFCVNLPLPPLAGKECYRMVFEEIVEPLAKEFWPQIIIRNGGSDPHFSDPLTNLGLSQEGFFMVGQKTKELAEICDGKEIDLIASGYNLKTLNACWGALLAGLLGLKIEIKKEREIKEPISETKILVCRAKKILKKFWKCFS